MEFTVKELEKFLDRLEEAREIELINALPEVDLQVIYAAKEGDING